MLLCRQPPATGVINSRHYDRTPLMSTRLRDRSLASLACLCQGSDRLRVLDRQSCLDGLPPERNHNNVY